MNKYYTVIYTRFDDASDGLAKVLGTYNTKDEATLETVLDVDRYCKENNMDRFNDVRVDCPDCIVMGDECRQGCKWQILEIEIKE